MYLNTKLRISASTLGVFLAMVAATAAQGLSANESGCALIDKKYPAQFVTYDGNSASSSDVKLRVRNNTNCAITVVTDDVLPTQIVRLENGGLKIESVKSPQDGVRLRLHYLVHDAQHQAAPKAACGWGDSVFTYEIPAGQSVVFSVPQSYFERGFDIAVPFNYSWENSRSIGMGVGGVVHRIYFLAQELPKETRPKKQ